MKLLSDFLFYKKSLITQIPDTEYRGQNTEVRIQKSDDRKLR